MGHRFVGFPLVALNPKASACAEYPTVDRWKRWTWTNCPVCNELDYLAVLTRGGRLSDVSG